MCSSQLWLFLFRLKKPAIQPAICGNHFYSDWHPAFSHWRNTSQNWNREGAQAMIAKCDCQQCGQPIEFDIEHDREFVACPTCDKQTRLLIPIQPKAPRSLRIEGKTPFVAAYLMGAIVLVVAGYAFSSMLNLDEDGTLTLTAICGIPLYFVPTAVGWQKKNRQAIFMLNLLAGWTTIGWVVAMVWACMKD